MIGLGIPRIRGRAAQIEEPIEDKGKWCYKISLWDLAGENQIGDSAILGPFETKEQAQENGLRVVKEVVQAIEKDMTGEISDQYFDLKNGGVMRSWKEH